jgi:NAD(P)-dependent dehydrogenase (short-subunit alcohol dehydrogenase family)
MSALRARLSLSTSISTAAVIGASTGIGEALVHQLAREGVRVAAVARRIDLLEKLAAQYPGKVIPYAHDVRQFPDAAPLFDRIVADLGQLDCLVYNAGVMPKVEESEYNFDKDREMVEVNLLGAMAWMNPCGAYMEARRSGTIVGISSVAGDRGRRGNPGYHTSKAALTTYLESLRNRMSRYGVTVVTVKPGPVKTPMTTGLKLPLMIEADAAAAGIIAHMRAGSVSGYVPAVWGPIMAVISAVPSSIFRRTNI